MTADQEEQILLHAQREQLARAGRLSTLGELTASIAHEMNQPLTAIALYAQSCERLLGQKQFDAAKFIDALRKLSDQALRAGAICERIQSFVRHEPEQRCVQSLNDLLSDIEPLASGDAHSCGIELEYRLTPDLPLVSCSAINIQQITLNLLRNAFEAMSDIGCQYGSSVALVSQRVTDAYTDAIMISVVDQGPGIDANLQPALFNPFHTTKKAGVGLGLSTCQTLISKEGGTLDFCNRTPYGCTFWYTLPALTGNSHE